MKEDTANPSFIFSVKDTITNQIKKLGTQQQLGKYHHTPRKTPLLQLIRPSYSQYKIQQPNEKARYKEAA
jgi:hypothetical protein